MALAGGTTAPSRSSQSTARVLRPVNSQHVPRQLACAKYIRYTPMKECLQIYMKCTHFYNSSKTCMSCTTWIIVRLYFRTDGLQSRQVVPLHSVQLLQEVKPLKKIVKQTMTIRLPLKPKEKETQTCYQSGD